jgi:hypothetical protein
MESKQKPTQLPDYDNDKDISYILYKTAQVLKRAFASVGRAFISLGLVIRGFVLFLLENLVWLLIGFVIGLGYGFYKYFKTGPQYSSEMVVQTNFNSARPLYESIDHLNTLIGAGRRDELSRIFKISPAEAAQLGGFSIQPEKNELIIADLYKRKFLQVPFSKQTIRQDTFWTRTIPYPEFKESLTKYDYLVHRITATSYNPNIFAKLEDGIASKLPNNELAEKVRKAETENNQEDIAILASAIAGLDTLRRTYNEKMLKGQDIPQIIEKKPGPPQNDFTYVAPELELYDRLLELKEELKNARRRSVLENNVVEVQSQFMSPGQRVSLLEEDILPPAIIAFILVLCVLLLIQFVKFFLAFKGRRYVRSA